MCVGGQKPVFSPSEVYCIVSYRNRTIRYGTEYPYLTMQFMAHTCVSPEALLPCVTAICPSSP